VRGLRSLLLCCALLLAAPASALAATRPELGVVDVADGQRVAIAHARSGWSSVRWTPDGSAIAAVTGAPGKLEVRRYAPAGGSRGVRHLGGALEAALSWDGSLVAERHSDRLLVREVATGRVRLRLPQYPEDGPPHGGGLEVAWSRDGGRLAYVAQERRGRTLRVADLRSGTVVRRVGADGVYGFDSDAFSPAGDRLAYPGANSRLTLLDVASGAVRRIGKARVRAVAWAPAGEQLAISTQDGVFAGDELAVAPVLPGPGPTRIVVPDRFPRLAEFAWSPDGRRIAYSSETPIPGSTMTG
jgi:dipeptidyl aminopeptidase/acylaminoacyl peptidase